MESVLHDGKDPSAESNKSGIVVVWNRCGCTQMGVRMFEYFQSALSRQVFLFAWSIFFAILRQTVARMSVRVHNPNLAT